MGERGAYRIQLAGEEAVLLPDRALWIPAQHTLLVADLHWGKAAAFRAAHVPVPTGTTAHDLARLDAVLERTGARTLVVLGDLLHARHGRHPDTMDAIAAWRAQHSALDIVLVRGNHDVHAGDPPDALGIACVNEWRGGPFVGLHDAEARDDGYVLSGHLHPHVTLAGRGRQRARLACFVFGATRGVLPAFSSFTGGGMYEHAPGDALYGIADDVVLAVP